MAAGKIIVIFIALGILSIQLKAQNEISSKNSLTEKQQSIISIAALTAKGDLQALKPALNTGLDAGLTVNEIKEVLVHLYAYCGFPRSIRGLQTFMEVLDERKAKGIKDETGRDASPIHQESDKYERGKKVLGELTKTPQNRPLSGYNAFAPAIDTFLKEHLFADIFERDVLTFAERELVTISVLTAIGGAEPMLKSHLAICLNVGLTPGHLTEFSEIIKKTLGEKETSNAQTVVNEVLKNSSAFPKGEKISNNNFTGTAYVHMMITPDNIYNASIGNVTFEPKARTNWHKHPGGQILLVTDGKGFYQEKGKPVRLIQKGDVVRIPLETEHWHGAASDGGLTHIAISPNQEKGSVQWMKPVTEEEYSQSIKNSINFSSHK
jgi:quercetin dioxygenase-like cupin family protein/alkylhydroperoxidase/carboxymuconolactone decarboxylase family protein YurZ